MDIATHAIMGGVLAAPWFETHPASAVAFAAGSVAPDLDALSRTFGKRAFLKCHQTYTHSLPLIVVGSLAGVVGLHASQSIFTFAPLWFGLGMILHVLLDVSNTYGTKVFAPLSDRRFSTEWSFFIDGGVWLLNGLAVLGIALKFPAIKVAVGYGVLLTVYLGAKAILRRMALKRLSDVCVSLIPSAMIPWKFMGVEKLEQEYRIFEFDLSTTADETEATVAIEPLVEDTLMEASSNFRTMRSLSHAYAVVKNEPTDTGRHVVCRDLRTRNFSTSFGELVIKMDPDGNVESEELHV